MILLIQDRKNNLHLVDYTPPSGRKFTICGLIYRKEEILNTLALDNAVAGICRTCYEDYQTMYGDDLNTDPRIARSSLNKKMWKMYYELLNDYIGPEIKYFDMETRNWEKFNKYTRKVLRKDNNVAKRK